MIENIPAGNFQVTILDSNGCQTSCGFSITDPSCTLNISAQNIRTSGATDKTVDPLISILQAVPCPNTFDWGADELDGIQNPENLLAGTYNLTLSDNNNCQVVRTFTVTDPVAVQLNCQVVQNVTIPNGSDGQASVNLQGGQSPYRINWTGPSDGNINVDLSGDIALIDLSRGTYRISIEDVNDCTTECSFTITGPDCSLSVDYTSLSPTCFGINDGSINLNFTNAAESIQINWGITALFNQRNLSNLSAGNLHGKY